MEAMEELLNDLCSDIEYASHEIKSESVTFYAVSKQQQAECPDCGQISAKADSSYERVIYDLPIMGKRTIIVLRAQTFKCANEACRRKSFSERFSFLEPHSRRTKRLNSHLLEIAVENSAIKASSAAKNSIAPIGRTAIGRLIKKNPPS